MKNSSMNLKEKLALMCKRERLPLDWQKLRFGFERAAIECDTHELLQAVLRLVRKMDGVWVDWWCCFEGEYEGVVYVMSSIDYDKMSVMIDEEKRRIEDWWIRYHNADDEIRKLMACGNIS